MTTVHSRLLRLGRRPGGVARARASGGMHIGLCCAASGSSASSCKCGIAIIATATPGIISNSSPELYHAMHARKKDIMSITREGPGTNQILPRSPCHQRPHVVGVVTRVGPIKLTC